MDDLASSEPIDSPHIYIPIHALYRCCLDTLSSISAVGLHDENFKTYYARLTIWGAGLFTEGPAIDKILKEEPERYRPLLVSVQNTLFSIAVEEVVFLKSRHLFDGNSDIRLRLDPLTNTLLDLVSHDDTAILACKRRLPHLATTPTIVSAEPLTLQRSPSLDTKPCGSNRGKTWKDQSLKSQDARTKSINRLSEKIPAANEVINLSTKKEDAVDRVQAASPELGEHGLKEDSDASLRRASEACHEDYDIYLGDLIESLFDLLPSIRGIRRTRLLETEFHQSAKRSSFPDPVKQAVPQAGRTWPESGAQGDKDSSGSRNTKKQSQTPPKENTLELALPSQYDELRRISVGAEPLPLRNQPQRRTRKILSLDGGGVRGLSEILILQSLMQMLSFERRVDVEPWQEFDMICGTSTGGLLAIMLGRLKMTLAEAQSAYLALASTIFAPKHHKLNPTRWYDKLKASGKYPSEELNKYMKDLLKSRGMSQDELLKDPDPENCKVFICAVRAEDTSAAAVIRSYQSPRPDLLYGKIKIWEAARATSAATTFFNPIEIMPFKQRYVDGALGWNNPIEVADVESRDLWENDDRIIVSLGTGSVPRQEWGGDIVDLARQLAKIVMQADLTNDRFRKSHPELVNDNHLFRFTVTQGLGNVSLDEHEAFNRIAAYTDTYVSNDDIYRLLKTCVRSLKDGGHPSVLPNRAQPFKMAEETPPAPRSTSEQRAAAEDVRRYALLRSIRKEGGAEAFVRSFSQQFLLQHDADWGDLLGAAPQALCFLGQCFVATMSSAAISSLNLPPESGLKERTLRANLLHCSDLGRRAFNDAQSKMDKVHMLTTYICEPKGPIDKILRLLDDENLAILDLQRQLDKLKRYSHDCVKDSAQVKERFAIWQQYATEIRRACTAAEDREENEKIKFQDTIVIAETRLTHQEGEAKRTEQETASFRSHVDVQQDGYKKAEENMPIGWNLIAQEAASKLINVWPDFIPRARVARPWAMFAAGVQSDEDDGGTSVTFMPNPHDDYAFRVSEQISRQLHSLNKMLHHGDFEPPEYGIDWNSLYAFNSSRRPAGPTEGSIDVALGLFRQARSQAPVRLGQQSASSEEATDILEMIIDVCEEIYETKEAQKSFANAAQPRDKGMIRRWRETINSACNRIDILKKQLASAETEHTEYIQNLKDSGSKRKKTKKGMSGLLNKNNVLIARENYLAALKALAESEKLLAERVEREAQAKIKFNEVQLELAKLKSEDMNMEQIKTVLKKCIDNLTHFLEHLDKLVLFFSSLYNFVDMIYNSLAQEFLAQVKNIITIDRALAHSDQERRRARKKSLKDDLLVDALKLRGNYLVAGELASVYVDISKKHIMPGLNTVERLGLRSGEDSQMSPNQIIGQILKSARKAQSEISTESKKRRERLRAELYIQDREITEIGLMVDQAQLEDGEGSDYVNEWDEA